jgi:hypothetical protein
MSVLRRDPKGRFTRALVQCPTCGAAVAPHCECDGHGSPTCDLMRCVNRHCRAYGDLRRWTGQVAV